MPETAQRIPRQIVMVLLVLSIFASLSELAIGVLNSASVYVEGTIGLFTSSLVLLGFWIGCAVTLVIILARIFGRKPPALTYFALAMQILVLLGSSHLHQRVRDWNFNSRLSRRMEVVDLARNSRLSSSLQGPCDCFYADLPDRYSNLSAGKIVLVSRHDGGFSVTFFVERWGMFSDDDYTAFIFRSDDGQPRTDEEDTDRFTLVQPLQPHWFYARHT